MTWSHYCIVLKIILIPYFWLVGTQSFLNIYVWIHIFFKKNCFWKSFVRLKTVSTFKNDFNDYIKIMFNFYFVIFGLLCGLNYVEKYINKIKVKKKYVWIIWKNYARKNVTESNKFKNEINVVIKIHEIIL